MKTATQWLLVSILALSVSLNAAQPPRMSAWHDGDIVKFVVVNDNVEGVENEQLEEYVPSPLYSFGPPGNQPQFDVLSLIPSQAGYSPWWEVIAVVILDRRD